MRDEWGRQPQAGAFSLQTVADHDGALFLAYCEHLADSHASPSRAVSTVRSAVNGLLSRHGLPRVANGMLFADLQRDLDIGDSPAPRRTIDLPPLEARAIMRGFGFGLDQRGRPAMAVGRGVVRRWSSYCYRRWVALLAGLGVATLGRFDDLTWIQANSVIFGREASLRFVSVCFTHRKNVQRNTPEWATIPEVPGDPHCVYRLLVAVFRLDFDLRVDTDASSWRPPPQWGRRFLFPRVLPARSRSRAGYDPELSWGSRARGAQYRTQLRRALQECVGLERGASLAYGLSSMRSGGDSFLARQGVSQEDRMVAGHWATGAVELGYIRRTALEHARQRLRWGCAL